MSRSIREYLEHIHTETKFLLTNVTDLEEARFFDDEILKRAFTRSLEIIGEASKQIPQAFRDQHPTIPWREMTGMRDRLIHQYFGVLSGRMGNRQAGYPRFGRTNQAAT